MLLLYRRMIFGQQVNADAAVMKDLDWREISLLLPLAAMVLWLGLLTNSVMLRIAPSVDKLIADAAVPTSIMIADETKKEAPAKQPAQKKEPAHGSH
jgi:NADH-quinone oxidoreductase subunit M